MKSKKGMTPLHNAAAMGSKEIAELLIASGADVNAKTLYGTTPLDLVKKEHKDVADLLRSHGAVEGNSR